MQLAFKPSFSSRHRLHCVGPTPWRRCKSVAPFPTNPSLANLGINSGFNGNFLFREKQPAFVEPRAELARSSDGPLPAATVMQTQFPDSKPEYGVVKTRPPLEGLDDYPLLVEVNALVFVRQKFTETLASLIVNKLRAGIKVCVVKAPGYGGYGENRKSFARSCCLNWRPCKYMYKHVIIEEVEMNLENVKLDMLAHAICAFKIPHNFIIDQTNLYKNARRRKLKLFADFVTLAAVVFPRVEKIKFHGDKRFQEMGKATD
ncbi:60 kDa chaperonin [Striga asiatica]|uniref:60 kDa chaperonin n=1 Tax=Striga asiatica TaxID=4170 RepID=A0A5A7RFF3_STRAF|nr:60 kDa chaperonin [Striga asiatica]